jgi:hypothetical protein
MPNGKTVDIPRPSAMQGVRDNTTQLERRIDELEAAVAALQKQLDRATATSTILNLIGQVKGHSSAMPDYAGQNSDHDKRYLRISSFSTAITTVTLLCELLKLKPRAAIPPDDVNYDQIFRLISEPHILYIKWTDATIDPILDMTG